MIKTFGYYVVRKHFVWFCYVLLTFVEASGFGFYFELECLCYVINYAT